MLISGSGRGSDQVIRPKRWTRPQYFRANQMPRDCTGGPPLAVRVRCTVRVSPRIPYSDIYTYFYLVIYMDNRKSNFNKSNFASMLPANVAGNLSKDGMDWMIAALDPFHDFERPVEGAPDEMSSKSFTRRFNQTVSVSATADDDFISIDYFGNHGVANNVVAWGPDAYPDTITTTGVEIAPIIVLRSPVATGAPSLAHLSAGTATTAATFVTTQSPTIASRIISLGIEVVDITPSLYKKGTIQCAHISGAPQLKSMSTVIHDAAAAADIWMTYEAFSTAALPITSSQIAAMPGSYIGKLADGLYTPGRLDVMQAPVPSQVYQYNGTLSGSFANHQIIQYADEVAPRAELYQPTINTGELVKVAHFCARNCTSPSGFQPIRILCSGLAQDTTLQITVRTTVEYFPTPMHPFESGIATYSPSYDPFAFLAYHAILKQLPYGVPVGMNAKGDFWRMITSAAQKVAAFLRNNAPMLLNTAGGIATVLGQPEIAAVASAVAKALPPRKVVPAKVAAKRPARKSK